MGTALTGSSVASTYDALLKITDNGPVGGSLKTVTDGLGNDSALQVSTAGIKSTGTLDVTGASTLAAVSGTTGTFSGTLTPQALVDISGASAGQVKFPATQNASADANTLDDYEEGTWTPSVGGTATYTAQTGTYTKIGRLVFIRGTLTINAIGTGSTSTISGLPFSAATNTAGYVTGYTGLALSVTSLSGIVTGSAFQLNGHTAAAASITNAIAVLQSGTDIAIAATYQV